MYFRLFVLIVALIASLPAQADALLMERANSLRIAGETKKAFDIYLALAENGEAGAQNNLALMYRQGIAVQQNPETAAQWFQKAARQGHPAAQGTLGYMYLKGEGLAQSDEQALFWFKEASEKSWPTSWCNLGLMYYRGRGTAINKVEALRCFMVARRLGHPDADHNVQVVRGEVSSQEFEQAEELARQWLVKKGLSLE